LWHEFTRTMSTDELFLYVWGRLHLFIDKIQSRILFEKIRFLWRSVRLLLLLCMMYLTCLLGDECVIDISIVAVLSFCFDGNVSEGKYSVFESYIGVVWHKLNSIACGSLVDLTNFWPATIESDRLYLEVRV
jgi:hypothetical protein